MSKIEYPKTSDTPISYLPFSPAVCYGDLIFVSGQASVDKAGNFVAGTFEQEFRRSMENLIKVLHDAGSDLAHVVQTRNYVQDPACTSLFQELYKEYFKPPYPARTTITNCLTTEMHYEIECIAMRKDTGHVQECAQPCQQ